MKIKLIILFLLIPTLCFGQISTMVDDSMPSLNQQLRRTKRRLNWLESHKIDLDSEVDGVLPLANGGTETALTDPGADRIFFWDESDNETDWLVPGDNLSITGNNLNVASVSGSSNVIFQYVGNSLRQGQSEGEYIGTSLTTTNQTGNYRFLQTATGSATTILQGKWVKLSGVDTITFYAVIWVQQGGGFIATVTVDVGGQSSTATHNTTTPTWKTNTIDVSSLTDDTAYDISIKLHTSNGLAEAMLSDIVLLGS